jgi:hypothetical protein
LSILSFRPFHLFCQFVFVCLFLSLFWPRK